MTSEEKVPVQNQTLEIFKVLSKLEHEQVLFCSDPKIGLRAIIAIHDTTLGPALGGTRMWNYKTDTEALTDVLRLSRGMTYKSAISGLNLGGGKAVILGDSRKDKSESLFRRFGQFVDSLGGKYITAEDVGVNVEDITYVYQETKHVTGIPKNLGGSGDPSPFTALGVFSGLKGGWKKVSGSDDLSGKSVVIQGLGSVGYHLVKHLTKAGAKCYVSDIFDDKIQKVVDDFKATPITTSDVYSMDCDIFAPCALGGILNNITIASLKCSLVAGGSNNQLKNEKIHANMLKERGILYVPDFLLNAGGVINIDTERGGYNAALATQRCEALYEKVLHLVNYADDKNINTHQAALQIAEKRLAEGRLLKSRKFTTKNIIQ